MLRDQLVGELKAVTSADAAAIWARRILPAKNSLNIADARQLENAFQARLVELEFGHSDTGPQASPLDLLRTPQRLLNGQDQRRAEFPLSNGSKKAVLCILSRDEFLAIESM